MNVLDKAINKLNISDAGRGYDQINREIVGLDKTSKEITTKLNRFRDSVKGIENSIRSDSSLTPKEAKELLDKLSKVRNYIGNNLEV